MPAVAIIGGGPAGLMAAELLAQGGVQVDLYDAMPSVGRKFLLAGVGGMNITHSEPFDTFLSRYGARSAAIKPLLEAFPPAALREWIHGLGVETFVGSSGRVFPKDMKAAPLLRAWLHRLREAGVRFHVRHRWLGWAEDGALRLAGPQGEHERAGRCGGAGARRRQLGEAGVGRRVGAAAGAARGRGRALAAVELRLRRGGRLERASAQPLCRAAAENRGAALHRCGRTAA